MSETITKADAEKALRIISKAWGRRQSGYVFFPWIDRDVQLRTGKRRGGFNEGQAFMWPRDRTAIVKHMLQHTHHDLYWTTSLYEYPMRREDVAMDEHALWADLDAVDPSTLDDYPPTIAWESSPGRYQCLWVAASGDFQGASWPGNENQRMTYMIGADASGWDTVQLLRIPGWENHKVEYRREDGTYPKGQILWDDGPQYHPGDFAELPAISVGNTELTDALSADIDGVDRLEVIARIRLKMTRRGRDMLTARETSGDLSSQLWYLIRCLADVGCTVAEIVAVVRETVWNKFRDRHDEMRRLITEASKAIAQRSDEKTSALEREEEEEQVERPAPQRLGFLLKNIKRPRYLIDKVLTEGACGFIAGEPKCYKSWVGLDMALSIATGAPFLGQFRVENPGPVLYIQEEDPAPTLKSRSAKIWVGKSTDKIEVIHTPGEASAYWLPPEEDESFDPQVNAYIQQGLIISNEAWQLWLDETLAAGMDGEPYRLVIIDTLMMTAGDVDENRAQEMTTKVFKPLKVLSRKHNTAIQVIHHLGKADRSRPGQRMLGSVANHAWGEDSIYLSRAGVRDVRMDLESKASPGGVFRITEIDNMGWTPQVGPWRKDEADEPAPSGGSSRGPRGRSRSNSSSRKPDPLLKALREAGAIGLTTAQLADIGQINRSTAHKRMTRMLESGQVDRQMLTAGASKGSNNWVLKADGDDA